MRWILCKLGLHRWRVIPYAVSIDAGPIFRTCRHCQRTQVATIKNMFNDYQDVKWEKWT